MGTWQASEVIRVISGHLGSDRIIVCFKERVGVSGIWGMIGSIWDVSDVWMSCDILVCVGSYRLY